MPAEPSREISPTMRIAFQAIFVFIAGLFVFLVLGLSWVSIDQIWHTGRILPGIAMHGVDLSGLDISQAEAILSAQLPLGQDNTLALEYGGRTWQPPASQLGLRLDAALSARQAFDFGRRGPLGSLIVYQFFGRHSNHNLQPTVTFDQQAAYQYLLNLAAEIDRPVQEASLALDSTQVIATAGQTGRNLDIPASLERIADHIRHSDFSTVPLVVSEEQPGLMDASPFAAQAQEILSGPFELSIPVGQEDAGRSFSIRPEVMAPMLTFERQQVDGQTTLLPHFREDLLLAWLSDLYDRTALWPQNPRFIFNDETRQLDLLAPAAAGRELDITESAATIQAAIAAHENTATLSFTTLQPEVADQASAADLGITELVHVENSYFFGSSEPRIQNIEKSSGEFHGLLVAPGATFSMAANMGDISLDNGYSEALIIFNGRTIEGVGGGVCQVSTTLFRAAFFAGLPIEERHPHAYRVSYYEKTSGNGRDADLAGLDATVFIPLVDLKFTNDTPYWLLMETYINRAAHRITWKFYSTSDGRTVEWQTTGPVNIVEPKKPLYKKNPDLDSGEIRQVDWEADGADVRVDRNVYRDGVLILSDTYRTHYEPWRAIYEYGPGTDGIPETEED